MSLSMCAACERSPYTASVCGHYMTYLIDYQTEVCIRCWSVIGVQTCDFFFSSRRRHTRLEEHTSALQSLTNLVCRLLLEKKKRLLRLLTIKFCILSNLANTRAITHYSYLTYRISCRAALVCTLLICELESIRT